jgi:alkanesulfonate monooxygenase SsuD/methylene tetrahydromethanopterin reductase-like flavin-dependent oxidoreductase (luciferase family)
MLRETVEIVKSMWTQPETSYDGKFYKVSRAHCDPKPLQQPTPPVWIGGGGEQLTLRVVAEHADVSNFGSSLEEFIKKREILKGHCAAVGRDEDTIRKTISSEVFIRATEKEIEQAGSKNPWGLAADQWREKALVGTPEQVSEKIQKYLDAGCTGFIPWCPDYPSTETIELFAKKVIPNFR